MEEKHLLLKLVISLLVGISLATLLSLGFVIQTISFL